MSNLRKAIYIALVVYLAIRGYSIFFSEKPEADPVSSPRISDEAAKETAEELSTRLESLQHRSLNNNE